MAQLRAGVAKAILTPYVGAFMAGFAGRDHGCEGVHDDLYARAVVLESGGTTVAMVGCDLIGLSPDSVARIRERVAAEMEIAADLGLIVRDQFWYWTPESQAQVRRAEADLQAGRYETFESVDDLLADLDDD